MLWQVEIILHRRNRKGKYKNPRTVKARGTVGKIMCQNARCFRRNEARFTWSNVFTSVIWREAVTSDVNLTSFVTSGGNISSSARNS